MILIEIVMFVAGAWVLARGKLPSSFSGGGQDQIEGLAAKRIGILLMLPLPIAFIAGLVLPPIFGTDVTAYVLVVELVTVLLVGLVALLAVRFFRRPRR